MTAFLSRFPVLERRVSRAAALLTERRIRAQAVVLIVSCWVPYVVLASTGGLGESGNRIAGDFVHFYVLGSAAVEGQEATLYDEHRQVDVVQSLVPSVGPVRYLTPYGPQVSLFFAPLALLPYGAAIALWLTISALLYGLCVRAVWSACPALLASGRTVAVLAVGFPGFFFLLAFGQNSVLALLCFTLGYFALRSRRRFLAGLAFGTLVFKPQLGLAVAVVFVLTGEWVVVSGAVVAAIAQLGTAWLRYSSDVFVAYVRALGHVADLAQAMEWKPAQMPSLRGFFLLLVPSYPVVQMLTVVATLIALYFAIRVWRSQASLALRYAVLLLVTALTTPHFHVYDLVILAPALLLAVNWARVTPDRRAAALVQVLVYACYLLPLAWPLAMLTHVQASTIALACLTLVLGQCALATSTAIAGGGSGARA